LLAGTLQAFLAVPKRREIVGKVFAVVLLFVAVWLFVSGGR
jgi:threonine/homoserine/homoserine lactone efflux protein